MSRATRLIRQGFTKQNLALVACYKLLFDEIEYFLPIPPLLLAPLLVCVVIVMAAHTLTASLPKLVVQYPQRSARLLLPSFLTSPRLI